MKEGEGATPTLHILLVWDEGRLELTVLLFFHLAVEHEHRWVIADDDF